VRVEEGVGLGEGRGVGVPLSLAPDDFVGVGVEVEVGVGVLVVEAEEVGVLERLTEPVGVGVFVEEMPVEEGVGEREAVEVDRELGV